MMTGDDGGVEICREIAGAGHCAGEDVEDGSDGGAETSQHSHQDETPAVDSLPEWQLPLAPLGVQTAGVCQSDVEVGREDECEERHSRGAHQVQYGSKARDRLGYEEQDED